MINFLFLVFGIDVDVLSVEQDPGHLEVTVGHGLVQGRHSVRVRDVHIHRRMWKKMENSLKQNKNTQTELTIYTGTGIFEHRLEKAIKPII